tara:strand:- start:1365 stop:1568 length:204 start_codon:yes stop_codon:yes gene_type:complete
MNRQTNMNEMKLIEENEQWETHWEFIRSWLEGQVSVDNTVSTKHTIPVYAKVLRVMDELRPREEVIE